MKKSLLVIGGCGALGRSVVSNFSRDWRVASIGLSRNEEASLNVLLTSNEKPQEYISRVKEQLNGFSSGFDAIICTAGGWVGGSIKDDEVFKTYEKMHQVNVLPSIVAAHLSTKFLNKKGLLVLTGAGGIINNSCHDMLGYGLSKVAVHSLASSMACSKEMPESSTVIAILPQEYGTLASGLYLPLKIIRKVIDTMMNREGMPNADFATWAKPEQISGLLRMWAEGNNLPKSGSFAMLNVQSGAVVPEFI